MNTPNIITPDKHNKSRTQKVPNEKHTRIIFALLSICVMLFIASLYNRTITLDDAYFAEQAYWVNKVGYARTELFNGILDWGTRQYTYHKLHVWQIAVVIKYMGWSPYLVKSIPIIYLLLLAFASHYYFKRFISPKDTRPYYIFLCLLIINSYVVQFGFEARPEVMIMSIAFLSYYFLRYGVDTKKHQYIYLSGALAGTAALFHLNGIIYIFSGIITLIYMRKYKLTAIFTLSAMVISSIYWYEMISNDAISSGLLELTTISAALSNDNASKSQLINILLSLKRYARHVFDFSYTFLFILTVYFNRHAIKDNYEIKILLIYLLTSEVLLTLISPGGKSMYLILNMPYALIIISALINNKHKKSINIAMLCAIILYIITQAGHTIKLISRTNNNITQHHAQIIKKYGIVKTDKIIAPSLFVFNEIENATILSIEMFNLLEKNRGMTLTKDNLFNYALKNDIRIMILRKDFMDRLNNGNTDITTAGYRLTGTEYEYYIFERDPINAKPVYPATP